MMKATEPFTMKISTCLASFLITLGFVLNPVESSTRIVNGNLARDGQFPHMVQLSISSNNSSSGRKYCGGSLINAEWIVTAAHCFRSGNITTAIAGTVFMRKARRKVQVENIEIHPDYKFNKNHDIALLKLEKPLKFDDFIQPIDLPKDENDDAQVGEILQVAGFGETKNASQSQLYLRYVNMQVISNEDCNKEWYWMIKNNLMCAIGNNGPNETTCSGDSGNGLIRTELDGKRKLLGIVSYGSPGCVGQPKVFVRVSSYLEFIKETITRVN